MAYQCSSTNYVWSERTKLGQGACGAVYKAWHKETGQVVAVKTFIPSMMYRVPREIRMREFNILNELSHENIVRLIAAESTTRSTDSLVLVMEMCAGGSLLDVLDEPVNACGLDEEEFLLVLKHLTAGLKHLRDHDIVHRDIKPGNIMRFLTDTGKSIYKLADFGTARQLPPEEEFQSLCGTEEYLNPALYKHAVLRRAGSQLGVRSFSAATDLWSVGVTLYHCATGQLPFRSYEGRSSQRGRETVYNITTGKQSGVISGVQMSSNGPIEWSAELPDQCKLSVGLRQLVTPLLAGLLECHKEKMWDFNDYFKRAQDILDRSVLHVFDGRTPRLLNVFINGSSTDDVVKESINRQCGLHKEDQLLVYNGEVWDGSTATQTCHGSPVFVFKSSPDGREQFQQIKIPNVIPSMPILPSSTSPETNYQYVTACCEVVHYIRHTVNNFLVSCSLLQSSIDTYGRYLLDNIIEPLETETDKQAVVVEELRWRLHAFVEKESSQRCESLTSRVGRRSDCLDLAGELMNMARRVTDQLTSLRRQLDGVMKSRAYRSGVRNDNLHCPVQAAANSARLDEIVKLLEQTRVEWKQDRSQRHLSDDRALSQKYDRKRLDSACSTAKDILQTWCLPRLSDAHHDYGERFLRLHRIQIDVALCRSQLDKFIARKTLLVRTFDDVLLCHHKPAAELSSDAAGARGRVRHVTPVNVTNMLFGGPGMRETSSTPNLLALTVAPSSQDGGLPTARSSTGLNVVVDHPRPHSPAALSPGLNHLDNYTFVEQEGYLLVACSAKGKTEEERTRDCAEFLLRNEAHNLKKANDIKALVREQEDLIKQLGRVQNNREVNVK